MAHRSAGDNSLRASAAVKAKASTAGLIAMRKSGPNGWVGGGGELIQVVVIRSDTPARAGVFAFLERTCTAQRIGHAGAGGRTMTEKQWPPMTEADWLAITEADWLASEDPVVLFNAHIIRAPTHRLHRLVAVAMTRIVMPLTPDRRYSEAIDWAEEFAERDFSNDEVNRVSEGLDSIPAADPHDRISWASFHACNAVHHALCDDNWLNRFPQEVAREVLLAVDALKRRDHLRGLVFGFIRDVYSPVAGRAAIDPAWRTGTAVALARGMYESRDFTPMPILADALQDAGCDSDDILSHCRQPSEHVRGCWVVDLILGKA
jgi:hypothetical protein